MKHELRQMRTQGSGAIVNCSSLGGLVGQAGPGVLSCDQAWRDRPDKSAAMDYASRGIRVNAVCPGGIDTPMSSDMIENQPDAMKEVIRDQSIGRRGRPEEIAAAAIWLCSPAASLVLGVALPVDGGFTAHYAAAEHRPPRPDSPYGGGRESFISRACLCTRDMRGAGADRDSLKGRRPTRCAETS